MLSVSLSLLSLSQSLSLSQKLEFPDIYDFIPCFLMFGIRTVLLFAFLEKKKKKLYVDEKLIEI